MTRETKVGLVIAGSFLCLVGVVVTARMRKVEEPGKEAVAQAVLPRHEADAGDKKAAGAKKHQEVVPANHEQKDEKPNAPSPDKSQFPDPPPALAVEPQPKILAKKAEEEHQKTLKDLDAAVNGAKSIQIPGKPDEQQFRPAPPSNASDTLPNLPDPLAPSRTKEEPGLQLPELNKQPPELNKQQPLNPIPAPSEPTPSSQTLEKGTPPGLPPSLSPQNQSPSPMPPAPTNADPRIPEPLAPGAANPAQLPKDTFPSVQKEPLPVPLGNQPLGNQPLGNQPLGNQPLGNQPLGNQPLGNQPLLNQPLGNESAPPLGALPKPDFTQPPPLGSEPKVNSPPITIGAATLPKVKEFDVTTHICRPQDTTIAAVSQRYYGSDKYAEALVQYNREHFLGKQELGANPFQTRVGQKVFVPPAEILEAKYGNLIGSRPQPFGNVPQTNVLPPQNTNVSGPNPMIGRPTAVTPMPTQTPSKDKTIPYQVRQPKQSILEIARETLGDANRWAEIYRYNPNLSRELNEIPAGTVIQLPEYAKIR
ncbi:MAG: hypothetical protein HY040_28300 [Planctomycetes bacterium]|nr:hypothetical protein [Planctomycetota bacterium]